MRISELKILKGVPFTQEDKRWITFNSLAEQQSFFEDRVVKEFTNLSFIKGFLNKKIKLDFNGNFNELLICNYVMYKNEPYENKWIYAWITNFEYISDYCINLEIEIDYFQTYMGEIQFRNCEIEAQHSLTDGVADLEVNVEDPRPEAQPSLYGIQASTTYRITNWKVTILYKPNLILDTIQGSFNITNVISGNDAYNYRDLNGSSYQQYNYATVIYNRYYSGCMTWTGAISNNSDVQAIIDKTFLMVFLGYSIVRCYMTPGEDDIHITMLAPDNPVFTDRKINIYVGSPTLNNNKCYTSPYFYYELSNFQGKIKKYYTMGLIGATSDYREFGIDISVDNDVQGICYPLVYKNPVTGSSYGTTYDYGVELGDCAECAWNETAGNWARSAVGSIGNMALGAAKLVAGLPSGAKNVLEGATEYGKSFFQEDTVGGVSSQPILQTKLGVIGWIIKLYVCYNIDEIDKFFSLYGYYINSYTAINILGRQRWNYVKTKHANITGNIPIECKKIITEALDNGITFWHDLTNFDYSGEYGLYNPIINRGLTINYTIF